MVWLDMDGMPHLRAHQILIILQFLKENGYREAAHELERESGVYFDWRYFEQLMLDGKWNEAERYLSGFTHLNDNRFSTKIYLALRKQKYLEALDSNDVSKAVDILRSDLKAFGANRDLFEELTELLTLNNIWTNNKLAMFGHIQNVRSAVRWEIKNNIAVNPALRGKLNIPGFEPCRLGLIINQSVNWQHSQCAHPVPNPVIHTLLADHCCKPPESPISPTSGDSSASSQEVPMLISSSVRGPSRSTLIRASEPKVAVCLPHTTNIEGPARTCDLKTRRLDKAIIEVTSMDAHPALSQQPTSQILDDLPIKVIQTLQEELYPTDIDFHPIRHTYLLVGTGNGDIRLWEVGPGVKLFSADFEVWNMGACSTKFKEAMIGDSSISITRVIWSPDGLLFGAAHSRHLVQIYVFGEGNDVMPKLEIEAHDGRVNDLAFSATDKQRFVITCGDDATIKAWDVIDGVKMFTFEGHTAPVNSILPTTKSGIHFIFSTSVDGKIRGWLYDDFGARFDHDAPGSGCLVMAYSNDNSRLFSSGTNKDGESFLIELDEREGAIKRSYEGLEKRSLDIAHFHTAKSFLASGDEHVIKFWSMDNVKLLATVDAEGGLPAKPRIRINKEGSLLAVIADGNTIKILGPNNASQLLKTSESCSPIAPSVTSEAPMMDVEVHAAQSGSC
ncbi:protein TOPLESS-like [Rhodamnia argentea]|uniref:Protein TOPLESS-like n=1 Tax=Rhodamnia argentea TaxID=178133 RepID=A0A8B8QQ07_9MYRT|nr:protein TOPLESS-like [Rhodamnia argentea]